MKELVSAYAIGLLFGLGLVVSQMISPAKVLDFLDVAGAWDPTLAVVMAAALAVTLIGYRLVLRRTQPLLAPRFGVPTRKDIDAKLVGGAALFGIGWGMAGYCPGPALTALTIGASKTSLFVVCMLLGMGLYRLSSGRLPLKREPSS